MPVSESFGRRHCIPIIYTKGTHYEVGYDVGRAMGTLIHSFLKECEVLNNEFLPAYETAEGRLAYEETFQSVDKHFPQYISELQGIADGAKVPFHKLFLLHLDNITTNACEMAGSTGPVGCSTICVNNSQELLAHTEDAYQDVLNHFYFVSAHIISDKPQGKWGVKEERFTSLCYAGYLPGYTMSYNYHGFIFSINTLSALKLLPGKIPRYFLTRALLAAETFEQAQKILRDSGCGAADGFSINMTFLNQDGCRLFHNAEVGPAYEESNESQLNILTISPGEHMIHVNAYQRLPVKEVVGGIIENSSDRMDVFKCFNPPKNMSNVIEMLGDQSGRRNTVFQDGVIKTIAVGIFDCKARTWSIYSDNPKTNEPLVVLPLVIKSKS